MMVDKLQIRDHLWQIDMKNGEKTYSGFFLDGGRECAVLGQAPGRYAGEWIEWIKELLGSSEEEKRLKYIVVFEAATARQSIEQMCMAFPEAYIVADMNVCYELEAAPLNPIENKVEIRGLRTLEFGEKRLTCISQSAAGGKIFYVSIAPDEFFVMENGGLVRIHEGSEIALAHMSEEKLKNRAMHKQIFIPYVEDLYLPELTSAVCKGLRAAYEPDQVEIETMALDASNLKAAAEKIRLADAVVVGSSICDGKLSKQIRELLASIAPGKLGEKKASFYAALPGTSHSSEKLGLALNRLGANVLDSGFSIIGRLEAQDLKNAEEYAFNLGCMLQQKQNPRGSRLVKCLVCGEVFDSSLGICPVCGVGLNQCVPVSEDEIKFKTVSQNRYLILGGGTAAVNAADSIRLRDSGGEIVMIMEETHLPINRPMLTKDLDASLDPELISLHPEDWYQKKGIKVRTGVRAKKINVLEKNVELSDGRQERYDKLIYAVGSECFTPPFEGTDKKGVVTIRHIADVQSMMATLKTAQNAVIIGGGVLGLEAAYEIWRRGIRVTVLEATPQFIGRNVSAATAQSVQSRMERMGVECHTSVSIAGMEGDANVTGVRQSDGTTFPADLVIISCGSRANIALAQDAGIETERAVVVNEKMETNLPDVYACGDCAQLQGINYQLWSEASMQGKAAGANAAGDTVLCTNVPAGLSMDAFGMQLFSIGDVGKTSGKTYNTVNLQDDVLDKQLTYWFSEGILTGITAIGYPERTDEFQNAVLTGMSYGELFR